ncbi:plexin domain-containing protein 2 isoform X3 [Cherax quadricarinatus]|uniref:plexin domain-containing protein 2 isoform X3 n=1 Tax=Cherax quadricarinatus TaxID=27406 RepID=UPI0023785B95|nr:plexin domain-containing protein 2-like isoform X1 [Cherax quadricarinatus]
MTSVNVNMAVVRVYVVLISTFLLLYFINTSSAHISDADYNRYVLYDGYLPELEDLQLQPLLRVRRSDAEAKNEDSKLKGMKPADTLKNDKANKFPDKTDAKKKPVTLKKTTSSTKAPESFTTVAPVKIPSDYVSVNASTMGSLPVTTPASDATTNSTTTTTTTATTIVTSIPESNNESRVNLEDNRTRGLTVSENVTNEEEGDSSIPVTTINNVTGSENPAMHNIDTTVQVSVDDPDSGDDTLSVTGYDTRNTSVDHHRYYRSYTYSGVQEAQQYWVDLDSLNEEKVITNEMLSASHRRAATVMLTFEFPFYGHLLKNITIATGGFLFTGEFVHTWLAATQYIAPLMANFDTSMSSDAAVKYADNGTSFTVQWHNVLLKDHVDAGTFTFQATLHKNGDIVFTYKQVPVIVTAITDEQHPVKVGLSDAYIVDRKIFYVRRKTIYEYHKIDMKKNPMIGNWTAIVFKALPTCVSLTSCNDCLSQKINFQCQWCSIIGRCSNGLDRHRQEWLKNDCESLHIQNVENCAVVSESPTTVNTFGHDANVEPYSKGAEEGSTSVGTVVVVVFLVALLLGVAGWVTYAYFFPHSSSGQILIRYRPSTWSWKRGEARYTAASIHSIHIICMTKLGYALYACAPYMLENTVSQNRT